MKIKDKVVLITGANRGIGRALVLEALRRGASTVYAGMRAPVAFADKRVISLALDITDPAQVSDAALTIGSLDVLINNAGVAYYDDLRDSAMLDKHLAVNLYGPHRVTRAFLPLLKKSHGAIVNNLSMVALAPFMPIASYSVSKAAAFSMTQSLRAFPAGDGVSVHAVMSDRHGHEPGSRYPENRTRHSGLEYFRGPGKRTGRDFPRSPVRRDGGQLEQRERQSDGAPECHGYT